MEEISITTEYIRLEALLKLSGLAGTGGEAKFAIQNGEVRVGADVCMQRGRKLRPGAEVFWRGQGLRVT